MNTELRTQLTIFVYNNQTTLFPLFKSLRSVDFADKVRELSGLNVSDSSVITVLKGFPSFCKLMRHDSLDGIPDTVPAAAPVAPEPVQSSMKDLRHRHALQEVLLRVCHDTGIPAPELREFVPASHELYDVVCIQHEELVP
jgi:hypothetical protein